MHFRRVVHHSFWKYSITPNYYQNILENHNTF